MSGIFSYLDPRRIQWGATWYAMHSRILRTKPVESMLEGTGTTTHGTKLAQVLTTMDLVSLGFLASLLRRWQALESSFPSSLLL
ncbi:putative cationic amino acid transporter, partial [Ophiophagus hannah]